MSDTRPDGDTVDETRATDAPAEGVVTTDAERTTETKVWTPDRDEEVTETTTDEYVPGDYSTRLYDADEVPAATTTPPPAADTATRAYSPDAETVAVAPVAAPAPVAPVAPVQQQPIFVQAPEQPIPRGNRGAAGAIGLLAAIVFAILYLAVALGIAALNGSVDASSLGAELTAALTSWALWIPVAVFFLAFWLLGAIINRGRWGAWVIFGLLVGLASYGGQIVGVLVLDQFWTLTATQGATIVQGALFSPLAIAAFVIGRELTIWFGAWVARRGRKITALNTEAQREYERTLEAGPKLYAS